MMENSNNEPSAKRVKQSSLFSFFTNKSVANSVAASSTLADSDTSTAPSTSALSDTSTALGTSATSDTSTAPSSTQDLNSSDTVTLQSKKFNRNNLPSMPYQPTDIIFPSKHFGQETFKRSFQPAWFATYTWLHYDVQCDAVLCFTCMQANVKKLMSNLCCTE